MSRWARSPDDVVALREQQVWYYRQLGWSQQKIADKLQITQPAVSAILRRVVERTVVDLDHEVREETLAQLAILWMIISESLRAWEKSKAGLKRVSRATQKRAGSQAGGQDEVVMTRQDLLENYGDVRFLQAARQAMADIRKLLNMETKHVKVDWQQYVPEGYSPDAIVDEFVKFRPINIKLKFLYTTNRMRTKFYGGAQWAVISRRNDEKSSIRNLPQESTKKISPFGRNDSLCSLSKSSGFKLISV